MTRWENVVSGLSAEDRLCLVLAQAQQNEKLKKEAQLLSGTALRWDLVLQKAIQHQVYPLLYKNLQSIENIGAPRSFLEEITSLYRANALRNQLLEEELLQLLGVLHDAGLRAVPWKGLYLAWLLYGDTKVRVCADIDLFVPRHDVAGSIHQLVAMGYGSRFLRGFRRDITARRLIEYPLSRASRELTYLVELHCGVLWDSSAEEGAIRDLWNEAQRGHFLGAPISVLSPEWELILLAAHAAKHHWQGLKWLMDIHLTALRADLCWERLAAKSRQWRMQSLVQCSLTICQGLLGTPMPKEFLEESPPRIRVYPHPPAEISPVQDLILFFSLSHPSGDKARLAMRRLFVPTLNDWRFLNLPPSWSFLYYLLRPLRVGYAIVRSLLFAITRGLGDPLRRSSIR